MAALTKLTDRFVETDIDEEIIIMRLDNGELLTLAGPAASIWRLIDGARDRSAVLDALTAEFAAEEPAMASDLDEFLGQLRESGLLAAE
jgi:pyrroloquinoline quinone biosynthesis protein D